MDDPRAIAESLANQVENWYDGGKYKRDQFAKKLREQGLDEMADELIRWFETGDKRFKPLIKRLRTFEES